MNPTALLRAACILLLGAFTLHAEVPSLINYQGRLTDAQGEPVTGNRSIMVRIYDAPTGGNMTYEENIGTVAVENGTYGFRFGSGGGVAVSANETIATTNGTNQIFNGTLIGLPISGTLSLTDGTYSWTPSSGSNNPSAFGVTYNGTTKSFQIIYYSQVPVAGREIVAGYQTMEEETIDASIAGGEAYLALSVNGTEESTRTRLLAVPYALKAKESEDTIALRNELNLLGILTTPSPTPTPPPARYGEMVTVQGGTLVTSNSLNGTAVSTFQIGKYEVTWDEWQEVKDWAVDNGYSDLAGVGAGSAGNHPVQQVNWYDVVKWLNAKSEKEGLTPVYTDGGEIYRTGEVEPDVSGVADGYRLPTEAEWEWAARGGVSSQGYIYSGSDNVDDVAWYFANSGGAVVGLGVDGRGTWPVGLKASNEIGIHDMSGNVWEWCWDVSLTDFRSNRGGSWGDGADTAAVATLIGSLSAQRNDDFGFRLARSSGL